MTHTHETLLRAASQALRSYQYGNRATDLAEEVADEIDAALAPPELSKPATAALAFSPVHVPPWLVDLITRFVPEDKQAAAIVVFSTAQAEAAP